MVTSSIDANPLDPETKFKYGENGQKASHQSDLDVIMDRNVAPSPREVCADLAQQHALEDLHDVTEHSSEQHASMNCDLSSSRRSSDRGTQYDEPRKPEE
ncbi:uncharacterized protein N7484_003679 [Penicillium longicatenatum]|uniref:uncharacterized protein n=1 Tax=Penicillium longicatenatum TaxID=1561947 RepID=UPI002548A10B|nr:uncharacterized protein N7484_003679 [Penicillium longicatenatum]KAJ5649956.1 hypothetical protein N7484_003679 [Penicillium longicatenatum]